MSSPGGHPCNRAHPLRVVDGTHRQDRSWVPDRVVPHSRGHRFREAGGHSFLSYISLPHISPVFDPQPVEAGSVACQFRYAGVLRRGVSSQTRTHATQGTTRKWVVSPQRCTQQHQARRARGRERESALILPAWLFLAAPPPPRLNVGCERGRVFRPVFLRLWGGAMLGAALPHLSTIVDAVWRLSPSPLDPWRWVGCPITHTLLSLPFALCAHTHTPLRGGHTHRLRSEHHRSLFP